MWWEAEKTQADVYPGLSVWQQEGKQFSDSLSDSSKERKCYHEGTKFNFAYKHKLKDNFTKSTH